MRLKRQRPFSSPNNAWERTAGIPNPGAFWVYNSPQRRLFMTYTLLASLFSRVRSKNGRFPLVWDESHSFDSLKIFVFCPKHSLIGAAVAKMILSARVRLPVLDIWAASIAISCVNSLKHTPRLFDGRHDHNAQCLVIRYEHDFVSRFKIELLPYRTWNDDLIFGRNRYCIHTFFFLVERKT